MTCSTAHPSRSPVNTGLQRRSVQVKALFIASSQRWVRFQPPALAAAEALAEDERPRREEDADADALALDALAEAEAAADAAAAESPLAANVP